MKVLLYLEIDLAEHHFIIYHYSKLKHLNKKILVFGIRRKDNFRNTGSISNILHVLSKNNIITKYHILLTGDDLTKEEIFSLESLQISCIYRNKTKIDKNTYNFIVNQICDIFIGPVSGCSEAASCRSIPLLLIDAFPFGFGLNNGILAYKIPKSNMKNKKLYNYLNFDVMNFEDYDLWRDLSITEYFSIVIDFLERYEKNKILGISPNILGLYSGPLVDFDCKISCVWYDLMRKKGHFN